MQIAMVLSKKSPASSYKDPGIAADVQVFGSEKELLEAWLQLIKQYDPDALIIFQVNTVSFLKIETISQLG